MNLSAWRYRLILDQYGGPLSEIALRPASRGQPGFEASAHLCLKYKPYQRTSHHLYGSCDGSGTSLFQYEATAKAVSEALERWAFYESSDSQHKTRLGFDIDGSTSGMAAYPALTSGPARNKARLEAIERWALCQWWAGNTRTQPLTHDVLPPHTQGFKIVVPWHRTHVVVLFSRASRSGPMAFGFSAETSLAAAIDHASVELLRNVSVLAAITAAPAAALNTPLKYSTAALDLYERRLLYFSGEGFHLFSERL